jgi:acetate kinase
VDPGALLYLIRHGTSVDELDRTLEHESGLAALGGLDDPHALALFAYRVAAAVGAMAAALRGLDALVFTAGIGEHRADVRAAVAERLDFLGVELDARRNAETEPDCNVAAKGSRVGVHVVRAREDLVAARSTRALLASERPA